jgi:hypothetical protein
MIATGGGAFPDVENAANPNAIQRTEKGMQQLRNVSHNTIAIAAAVPAQGLAWVAERIGASDQGRRIKTWLNGIPPGAYLLTALLWALVIWRGVLYPAFGGAKNLRSSWGGPTLAGAWAVHLAIAIGALVAGSLLIALTRRSQHESVTGRPAD